MSGDSSKTVTAKSGRVTRAAVGAIIFTGVVYILAQVLAAVFISVGVGLAGFSEQQVNQLFGGPTGQFLFVFVADGLVMAALALLLRWRRYGFWGAVGLDRRPTWRDLGYTVGGYVVYFAMFLVVVTIAGIAGVDTEQKQELGFESAAGAAQLLLVFAALVLLAPVVEEILFRGFLYGQLRRRWSIVTATLITSTVFALPHLFGVSEGVIWVAAIDTFVLSLVLCYVREKTGSIWASVGIHAVKNALAFTLLYLVVQ